MVLHMFTLLKQQGCQVGTMKGPGKNGAITLVDCRRALKNEMLYDLLEFVNRRIPGDEASLAADIRAQIGELMRELVG